MGEENVARGSFHQAQNECEVIKSGAVHPFRIHFLCLCLFYFWFTLMRNSKVKTVKSDEKTKEEKINPELFELLNEDVERKE